MEAIRSGEDEQDSSASSSSAVQSAKGNPHRPFPIPNATPSKNPRDALKKGGGVLWRMGKDGERPSMWVRADEKAEPRRP